MLIMSEAVGHGPHNLSIEKGLLYFYLFSYIFINITIIGLGPRLELWPQRFQNRIDPLVPR